MSGSGIATNVAPGNVTIAYPMGLLDPPSADPPGTTHTLIFGPPFPPPFGLPNEVSPETPRQQVIAFDLDWAEHYFDPNPQVDYVPIEVPFVGVVRDGSEQYTFELAPTAHVIRFWHGACAIRQPWEPLFDDLSKGFTDGLDAQAAEDPLANGAYRIDDAFSPLFIGNITDIDHGFGMEGLFAIDAVAGPDIQFLANAGYRFGVDPLTEWLSVEALHAGVTGSSSFDESIEDAMRTEVPKALEAAALSAATQSLYTGFFDVACDPGNSVALQQLECFAKLIAETGPQAGKELIEQALLQAIPGLDPALAESLAAQAASAVDPANFACLPVEGGEGAGVCGFHPTARRVNVLPNEFEFVLAGEDEADRILLYQLLPIIVAAVDPRAEFPALCATDFAVGSGITTFKRHGFYEPNPLPCLPEFCQP